MDLCELGVSLVHITSSRTAKATEILSQNKLGYPRDSQNIQPVAIPLGLPPEVEDKSLLLKTPYISETGPRGSQAGTDLNAPPSWKQKLPCKRPKERQQTVLPS